MEQIQDSGADDIITGPLGIGLDREGVESFIQRGQKVKKLRFFDGSEEFGLELPGISYRSLQKMAMTGLVSRIERSVTDFAHQRTQVMDLTRCFAVATVYRQFETRLWEIISKSELLISWNRANPRLNISPAVNSSSATFQMLIGKAKEGILGHKQEVLKAVQSSITSDAKTLPEEKKALILLAIRYLNAIDPAIWLLLATSRESAHAESLVADLRKILIQYVGRSELPEYLALMLVELVVIVGNVTGDAGAWTEEDGPRPVYISYQLGSLRKSQEERTKVHIQVGNETSEFSALRTRVDQQGNANLKHKSLDTFFAGGKSSENGGEGTSELGLYYLSYLKEACRTMDISLDSFVNSVPHTKRTLINIILAI